MQTAVEWLLNELNNVRPTQICSIETIKEWFEQAKEMEKQQIIDAAERWKGTDFAEKYYAETYGSKGSDAKCPNCGAMEVDAISPRTIYECGSSDYDQRPNTFKQSEGCKGSSETKTN